MALLVGAAMALSALADGSSAQVDTRTKGRDAGVDDAPSRPSGPAPYHPEPSRHAGAAKRDFKVAAPEGAKVLRIPIEGTIDLGLSAFVERALSDNGNAVLVVLDINTLGGRVDAAIKIRDALLKHDVRTVAFVHPRAISAGALIALACDVIAMAPGATIGAAKPVTSDGSEPSEGDEEKMTSYMRTEMRATAEAKGRRGDIAEAMVDRSVVIEGVVGGGKLLTLDTDRALALNMAELQAPTVAALLEALSLRSPNVSSTQENWAEKIARFLTDPAVAGLLMSLGMLGLLIELYSPGVGLPGAVGVLCLSLFFGGHMITNLAGLEEVLLLLAGLALLAVELFVLPGFGIAGIAGIACIAASFFLTLLTMPLTIAWDLGMVAEVIERLSISLLATLALGLIALRFLPKTRAMGQLVLSHSTTTSDGFVSAPVETALIGTTGVTLTDLHPAGKAELAGARHDVVADGEYIERGTKIRVVQATAGRIVVRRDA
jgi:membrane-bound serine protease (ClpP class)